jgi:DNA-directed RNA polymerase subunit RPC12/RpoP
MTLEVLILEDKRYRCPRCGSREEILDHDEYIGCVNCGLEFDKSDLEMFDEEDILARSEKQGIIKVLLSEFLKD